MCMCLYYCTGADGVIRYRVGVVADQDTNSKSNPTTWNSILKKGTLTYTEAANLFKIDWEEEVYCVHLITCEGLVIAVYSMYWL